MDTPALIASWLLEKHGGDQQRATQETFALLAARAATIPEFRSWLVSKLATIDAFATAEALDAARAERAQGLAAERSFVDAALSALTDAEARALGGP
jgi:hypothetical protein